MAYRATKTDQGTIVHDVPIFVECAKGKFSYDIEWIRGAFGCAQRQAAEGYFPPLHVGHHEPGATVRPGGFFKVKRVGSLLLDGKRRAALFADLVVTDPCVQMDVLQSRLPYRSVELLNPDRPEISSLALLDHEVPYLQMPMLMVSEVEDKSQEPQEFALANFRNPYTDDAPRDMREPVACMGHGETAFLLFRDDTMTQTTDDSTEGAKGIAIDPAGPRGAIQGAKFADGGDGDESKPEDKASADSGMDVAAIVKAIKSGAISVKDFDAIMEAIAAQRGDGQAEPQDSAATEVMPGVGMSADGGMTEQFAALQGQNAALTKRLDERDARDQRRDDVATALKRLEGRPVGSDIEKELTKFHAEHGAKAFAAYVDSMVQTFAAVPDPDADTPHHRDGGPRYSDAVMKFHDKGADALASAQQFSQEWKQLHESGHTRMTEERYIEIGLSKTQSV